MNLTRQSLIVLLQTTYHFVFVGSYDIWTVHYDGRVSCDGWARLDVNYRIQVSISDAGLTLEISHWCDDLDDLLCHELVVPPKQPVTKRQVQALLYEHQFPPAITQHRLNILRLLAS